MAAVPTSVWCEGWGYRVNLAALQTIMFAFFGLGAFFMWSAFVEFLFIFSVSPFSPDVKLKNKTL